MSKLIAFITGTSTGIGYSLANHLLSENPDNQVTGIGRNQTINQAGYKHITADFTVPAIAGQIPLEQASPAPGDTLVLVNNAGVVEPVEHTGRLHSNDIINHMNVNFVAPVVLTNLYINTFQYHPGPKLIINVSSGAASNPYDGWSCYCSSKAGLEMFAKVVDTEQKINKQGFKVFSVSPGVINTQMQDTIRKAGKEGFSNIEKFIKLKENHQLKDPDAIAKEFLYIIRNHEKANGVCLSF